MNIQKNTLNKQQIKSKLLGLSKQQAVLFCEKNAINYTFDHINGEDYINGMAKKFEIDRLHFVIEFDTVTKVNWGFE